MRYKSLPLSVRTGSAGRMPIGGAHAPRSRRLRDWLATVPVVILPVAIILPLLYVGAAGPTLNVAGIARPGVTVQVIGQGFSSRVAVQLLWDGAADGMPTARTDKAGAFTAGLTVPFDATLGQHTISTKVVAWSKGNANGSDRTGDVDTQSVSVAVNVEPASDAVGPASPTATPSPPSPAPTAPPTAIVTAVPTPTASRTATATPVPVQTPPPTAIPTATASASLTPAESVAPAPSTAPSVAVSMGILTSAGELAQRPMSGAAWNALMSTANSNWGVPNISDKNSRHGVLVLSGGLVYARTSIESYRVKVITSIEAAMAVGWYVDNGTELGISRNLGAYIVAADLVGYRTPAFEGWIRELLDSKVDTHSIWNVVRQVSEISANNHGTFALATRTAAAVYLGDRVDLDRSWRIFRGYSDGSWGAFKPTADYDAQWQCGPAYVPLNPSCVKQGQNLDGLPVDDAARSAYPTPHGGYINEAMQGYAFMGILFSRQGYPAWSVGDNAVLRVAQSQQRFDIWNYHPVGYHVAWVINRHYGADFPTASAGTGRLLGYTDWLYGP